VTATWTVRGRDDEDHANDSSPFEHAIVAIAKVLLTLSFSPWARASVTGAKDHPIDSRPQASRCINAG
jgi:hypothetical protein